MVDVPLRHTPAVARSTTGRRPGASSAQPRVIIPALRRPRWPRIAGGTAIAVAAIVVLGFGLRVGIDVYRASLTLSGLSPDPTPLTLTIGQDTIAVPRNMLRAASGGGAVKQADLVLHWPTLEGYAPSLAADFRDGSPSAPLIYATISERTSALDAGSRLDNIYTRYFVGDPLTAPAGLTARALAVDSGYAGEVVYYGPPAGARFVARCLAEPTADGPATCIRDIPLGRNLTLLYRFSRDLMGDWQALDAGMRALAAKLSPAA